MGLARERETLTSCGLPPEVVTTIQGARAVSARAVHNDRWNMFVSWSLELSPPVVVFQAPVRSILVFLHGRLSQGLVFSTVKGYQAAFSACHEGFGGMTVGRHPLVRRFLKRCQAGQTGS